MLFSLLLFLIHRSKIWICVVSLVHPLVRFLVHRSCVRIYVIGCVCPSNWLDVWLAGRCLSLHPSVYYVGQKLQRRTLTACELFIQIMSYLCCLSAALTSSCNTCSGDLDQGWGSQSQQKANLLTSCSHTLFK